CQLRHGVFHISKLNRSAPKNSIRYIVDPPTAGGVQHASRSPSSMRPAWRPACVSGSPLIPPPARRERDARSWLAWAYGLSWVAREHSLLHNRNTFPPSKITV